MTEPLLEAINLTKELGSGAGKVAALKGVSLALNGGELTLLMGPSGSGKTTLLSLCAGLDSPSGGDVWLAGHALAELSEDARARVRNRHTGFVFQNFQLIPTLTALENVLVPLELRGDRDAAPRGRELLQQVGLAARADHYPVQLSGGEQQRVALARAFISRPQVLFCDEPTGNLDGVTAQSMTELIFELNRAHGTTLVLVTHDLELAKRCQRILRLRNGEALPAEVAAV